MGATERGILAGRTAVVTGAASGIGRAIALELADSGADLLIHTRANRAGLEQVAETISAQGRQTRTMLADLADMAEQDKLVAAAWQWRPIDIWINNAGADVLTGAAAGWSFEQKLEQLWRVDVLATIRIARDVGRRMRQRASGAILNMGWDQARHGMEGDSGEMFTAVKGAVASFSRSLAKSLAPQVRVNCLAPGWIKTAWAEQASDYWQQRATREALLARWGTPQDVARVARFLASSDAAFISGEVISIGGGGR